MQIRQMCIRLSLPYSSLLLSWCRNFHRYEEPACKDTARDAIARRQNATQKVSVDRLPVLAENEVTQCCHPAQERQSLEVACAGIRVHYGLHASQEIGGWRECSRRRFQRYRSIN